MHSPRALIAAALFAVSLSSVAQQQAESSPLADVPIRFIVENREVRDPQAIAREALSPDQAKNLERTGTMLAVAVWGKKDDNCFVSVGPTAVPQQDRPARRPEAWSWAMSEDRPGDDSQAACGRALKSALQGLVKGDNVSLQELQRIAALTTDPAAPKFPKGERKPDVVSHWTGNTLNDEGRQAIADSLGPRWHKVLDHRKYSANVLLMMGTTLEGRKFCFVEYGVGAKPPEGVTAAYPKRVGAKWKVVQDKNSTENCSRQVVMAALDSLRDSYPDMLDSFTPERGMSYPSVAEIKRQVARYDAEQAKRRQEPRPTTTSTTRSTQSLRCTNECFNGSCVRTFENGRKERWQAPRRYNPMTQNWEWDTMTNACGA